MAARLRRFRLRPGRCRWRCRDRDGSFTPAAGAKGQRRIGGLGDMIISLYAGGMTLRDIQFHLASTIGTEVSRETISKIVDEISEEVQPAHRPLEPLYPVIYLDALIVKVKDGSHTRNKARSHRRGRRYGRDQSMFWVSGSNRTKARRSGPRCAPIWPTRASATCWWCAATG